MASALFHTTETTTDSPVTHAELAAASGSGLVGFLSADSGTPRTVGDKLNDVVSARDFGALGDGSTDDYASLQAAISHLETHGGGTLYFPRGNYIISQTLENDRLDAPAKSRVSFVGEDETATIITCTQGSAIHIRNAQPVQDLPGEQNVSNQAVRGLSLFGTSRQPNSAGLVLDTVANIHIEDVRIQGFDFGIYAQDMDQAYLKRCEIRFNNQGIFARRNPTFMPASTYPNNWVMIQCGIGSNAIYGAQWVGASTISMIGGIIATNGHGAAPGEVGFGVTFRDCGYEGGVGSNFIGTYFEDNNGIADVIIEALGSDRITSCVYNFVGCSFNRISATYFAVNSISANFGNPDLSGKQQLNVTGCSFKALGNYVPVAGRWYIDFKGQSASPDNFHQSGNLFGSEQETSPLLPSGSEQWMKSGHLDNYAVPPDTNVGLPSYSVIASGHWAPSPSGNGIVIPYNGTYMFTAQQVFTSSVAVSKRIRVLRADMVLGVASSTEGEDTLTVSGVNRFAAGDIVTIDVRQSSGNAMTVAGARNANCFVMLTRLG